MKLPALVLFILISFLGITVSAQQEIDTLGNFALDQVELSDSIPPHILKCLIRDEARIWSSPFRAQPKDLVLYGSVLAGTVTLIQFDEEIYREVKAFQNNNPLIDDLSPRITLIGDEKYTLGLFGAFYLTGKVFNQPRAVETSVIGFQTLMHTGFVIQVMKHIFGRTRPSVFDGEDYWHGPKGSTLRYEENFASYDSFPSGHTIIAWGMATVIAEQYKDIKAIPYISYTIATLAGLSRITEDAHWASDVLMGAFLGNQIGKFIARKGNKKVRVLPRFSRAGTQMSLIYTLD